jgi:hypothetical protein
MLFSDMFIEVTDQLEVLGVFWGSWVIVVFALYAANTHVAQWTYIFLDVYEHGGELE